MARIFRNGIPNFQKDEAELERRLEEIKKLINKPRDNISFVESVFQLMQDCNLITQDNINFLLDPKACRNFKPSDPNDCNFRADFYFMRNPSEGALRHVHDYNDVNDEKGEKRFYSGWDRRVELNSETYLLSNDWYKDDSGCPNKRAFYFWLKEKLTANKEDNSTIPVSKEPDDLKAVIALLKDLQKQVEDVKKEVKALYELWQ